MSRRDDRNEGSETEGVADDENADSAADTDSPADADSPDEEEWRFSLDEVGPEAEPDVPEPEPVDPGDPGIEGALFFVLGVLVAAGAFYALLF